MIRRTIKRLLFAIAAVITGLIAVAAACVWFIARDDVIRLRAIAAVARPVPPALASAIAAADGPVVLARPRFSIRALLLPRRGVVSCGPSTLSYALVRDLDPSHRPWRRHVESAVATYAVAYLFTPDELLRIYAHEIYLGTVQGRQIIGTEPASRIYFGKETRDLTPAEAATIAAMIRSPNVFSPIKYPARVLPRRNRVLERMERLGVIDPVQARRAMAEPIRTVPRRSAL